MPNVEADMKAAKPLALSLLPIMISVFIAFLVIGLALPVLPLHIHDDLGLGGFVVGVVAGAQFAASLVSRVWAGSFADTQGGKQAVTIGLIAASVSGVFYLLSFFVQSTPALSAAVLLVGRAILGGAESFIITGAVGWGLMLGGPANTGKVIAWIGTAMYAAFAVGAPVGGLLYESYGFIAISATTAIIPLITLAVVLPQTSLLPKSKPKSPMMPVIKAIWLPGIGLAMSSLGFGAMMTFSSLMFTQRGWTPVWVGVTVFAVAFILSRVFFAHVTDKFGGARVALICLVIEASGLALIWLASSEMIAVVGAFLTGAGYSLVYPGFGVEAVNRAPEDAKGLTMGAYTAFLDLALGVTSPVLGILASAGGTGIVFLTSALVVALAILLAIRLERAKAKTGFI